MPANRKTRAKNRGRTPPCAHSLSLFNLNELKGWLWNCPFPREALRISLVLLKSNLDRVKLKAPKKGKSYSYVDEKVYRDACVAYRKKKKRRR